MPLKGITERIMELCRRLDNNKYLPLSVEWQIRAELKTLLAKREKYENFQRQEAEEREKKTMDQGKRKDNTRGNPGPIDWTMLPAPMGSDLRVEPNLYETSTACTKTSDQRTQADESDEGRYLSDTKRTGRKT